MLSDFNVVKFRFVLHIFLNCAVLSQLYRLLVLWSLGSWSVFVFVDMLCCTRLHRVEYQETLYPSGCWVEALCCSIAIISVAQGEKEVLGWQSICNRLERPRIGLQVHHCHWWWLVNSGMEIHRLQYQKMYYQFYMPF